jgi:Lectin C-type domain
MQFISLFWPNNVYFIFPLQANWFRAAQYCRFHGMHLASISSQEENDRLEKHIRDFGMKFYS